MPKLLFHKSGFLQSKRLCGEYYNIYHHNSKVLTFYLPSITVIQAVGCSQQDKQYNVGRTTGSRV
jgi:hypothetical protein